VVQPRAERTGSTGTGASEPRAGGPAPAAPNERRAGDIHVVAPAVRAGSGTGT
jgi:hypothetical protein